MLNRFNISGVIAPSVESSVQMTQASVRYNRNEKDDLKTAIDALYEFKRKLDELHPSCVEFIDNILQRPRY
jgi:hypothetical protein